MLIVYFLTFFIINSTLSMEQIMTFDDFLIKHKETLQTIEGKHAFCNVIDRISSDLDLYNQIITISKKAAENITPKEKIIFTPLITFTEEVTQPTLVPISGGAVLFNKLLYHYELQMPYLSPKTFYNFFSIEKIVKDKKPGTTETLEKALQTDLIVSLLNTPEEIPIRNNLILLFIFFIIVEKQYNDFPYHCECSDAHINHLKNVCLQSACIEKTPKLFNFSPKWKFYKKNTLIMMTDLLHLLPFYDNICFFSRSTFLTFTQPLLAFCYEKTACKNCIESYEEIKQTIDFTLLHRLQAYYIKFHASLNIQEQRRSPLIFGPLEKLCQIPLTNPNNIFANFIEKIENPEPQISAKYTQQKKVLNDLLQEHYANKRNKKNYKNKTQRTHHFQHAPTKNKEKAHDEKQHATALSTAVNTPSSEKTARNLKEELKTDLKKYKLKYNTNYLNKCLAEQDGYHDFPWVIDQLVMEHGIPQKDLQDKNAVVRYWPITYTIDDTTPKYAVYKIVFDKITKSIFHRGPIPLRNINKLKELRSDPAYFETILNKALPEEDVFVEKEFNNNFLESTEEWFINENNHVIIHNLFKGPFGCKIAEVNKRYITITSLDNQTIIIFPLIM